MKEQGETPSEETLGPMDANAQPETSSVAPRMDLLVDEHEEEVSENGHTVRHKGIYLLPNLFTTAALFAGFYAIIAAMRGDFENAAVAIFFAMVVGRTGRAYRASDQHLQQVWGGI